jgi:hypothetical protein
MAGPVLVPAGPAAAAVNVTEVWSRTYPGVTFRESSPTPASLSTPAVVVGGLDGKVYALSLADGSNEPGWPVATGSPISGSPSAATLDSSGRDTIFVGAGTAPSTEAASCAGGGTFSFDYRGGTIWHNNGSDGTCASRPYQSSFAIGDITGSGQPDATIGELGLYSPSFTAASGSILPGWPYHADDTVFSSPALADLNGNGIPDVIVGGDSSPGGIFGGAGGVLRAIDGSGHTLWDYVIDEQVRSSPAIGNGMIVFGTGIKWVFAGGGHDATSLFALDFAGHLRWRTDLGGITIASPALADVLGNGQLDAIEGTDGTPTIPVGGKIWVLDQNGHPLPNWAGHASDGGAIIGGITTADLKGEGGQDLLVPTGGGIWAYDGRTGQTLFTIDAGRVSFQSSPLVTDDGGGAVGITVAGTRPDGTGVIEHYRVSGATVGDWPMFHHDARHTGNINPPPLRVAAASTSGAPPPPATTPPAPAAGTAPPPAVTSGPAQVTRLSAPTTPPARGAPQAAPAKAEPSSSSSSSPPSGTAAAARPTTALSADPPLTSALAPAVPARSASSLPWDLTAAVVLIAVASALGVALVRKRSDGLA